jgi:hypothetical protein
MKGAGAACRTTPHSSQVAFLRERLLQLACCQQLWLLLPPCFSLESAASTFLFVFQLHSLCQPLVDATRRSDNKKKKKKKECRYKSPVAFFYMS